MNITGTRNIVLEHVTCGECDIAFAVPQDWLQQRRQTGRTFTCPNGDKISYRRSENDQLRKELEHVKAHNTHLRDQRESAERSARAYKGQATKLKKRAANGVCPCCKRSFVALQRHMTNQHPDFVAEHTDG